MSGNICLSLPSSTRKDQVFALDSLQVLMTAPFSNALPALGQHQCYSFVDTHIRNSAEVSGWKNVTKPNTECALN